MKVLSNLLDRLNLPAPILDPNPASYLPPLQPAATPTKAWQTWVAASYLKAISRAMSLSMTWETLAFSLLGLQVGVVAEVTRAVGKLAVQDFP